LVGFVGLEPSDPRLCAALHITYKIDNGIVLPRWVEEETQEVSKISHSGFGGFQRWLFGFIGVRAGDYTTDQLIVIKEAFDSLSHDPNNPQNSPEYYIHTISNIPNNSDIHLVYRYHPAKPYLEYDDFYEVGSCQ